MHALHTLTTTALALPFQDDVNAPWDSHDTRVIVVAVIGIAIVVSLIVWLKLHAFIALTIAALFVGVASASLLGANVGVALALAC